MNKNFQKEENRRFKMFGEEFDGSHFPIIHTRYCKDRAGTEQYIKSIANAWHNGDIVSATQALESDLEYEAARVTYTSECIQIPDEYSDWYDKAVEITKGVGCTLSVYTKDSYDELISKIAKYMTEHGLVENPEHPFTQFLHENFYSTFIGTDGLLHIPENLLKLIGTINNVKVIEQDNRLVISGGLENLKGKILEALEESKHNRDNK